MQIFTSKPSSEVGVAQGPVFNVVNKSFIHVLFFFSSRRRHTRYWRDWSSDVCSSDLFLTLDSIPAGVFRKGREWNSKLALAILAVRIHPRNSRGGGWPPLQRPQCEAQLFAKPPVGEIGRASCRERV